MTHWKNATRKYFLNLLIILSIIVTTLPINVIMSIALLEFNQEDCNDISALKDSGKFSTIPRLIKESDDDLSEKYEPNSANTDSSSQSNNKKLSNFSIGTQEGKGGGNVAIRDSFNLTSAELLNTTNEIGLDKLPTTRNDSISILTPSNFARNDLQFNLSSIEAQLDWRLREDYMGIRTPWNSYSDDYKSVAMAFTVEEDYANLSRVRINLGVEGSPSGLIYIVNSTSSQPDNTKKISDTQSLLDASSWREYSLTVTSPLKKGITYFVVMNSTSDGGSDYWEWRINNNFDYNADAGAVYAIIAPEYNTWYNQGPVDLPLQIQVHPIEKQGISWVAKTYSSPAEVKIWYNTTLGEQLLTRFEWFDANNTEIHNFKSNISLTFTLDFLANYTYSGNPISGVTSYKAQNNSLVSWNITFSTAKITTGYLIRNHTITIHGIPNDWNGSQIYWNSTLEYPNLTTDVNVTWDGDPTHKYTHGNTTMVVNASTLAANTTWHVWLEAPNYLLSFNLSREGQYLDFPYKANVTDMIDLNFQVPEIGGNSSYWIEYSTLLINTNINFNSIALSFNETWDINKTVSQNTNVNGTYDLQAFWESSDKIKVGTITRKLDVLINTTLTINSTDIIEVIIGEKITIWANYTSNHNTTQSDLSHINYAKIWCNASWPETTKQNRTMNQPTGTYYNATFTTDLEAPGSSGTITISTQLSWFVNWTRTVTVLFVRNTTLTTNVKELTLQWRENATIEFDYNETGGNRISVATVTIVDTSENFTYSTEKDSFKLNSTSFSGVNTFTDVIIRANSSGYLTREWHFNLTITPGRTNITGKIGDNPVWNNSGITKNFSNSSSDSVPLNLLYYHNLTRNPLDIDLPTVVSSIPVSNMQKEINLSWSITFNPNETGIFLIKITFNLNNYENSTFFFHLTIAKACTAIVHIPLTDIQIYYTEYYDFFLSYKNTDYNENITGLNKDFGFTINSSDVVDLNQTDERYWFRFNPSPSILPLGRYSINITFYHDYFNSSFIEVTFKVIDMPTEPLNIADFRYNQSILVEDVLHIDGEGYQTIRGQSISNYTVTLRMNDTVVMKSLFDYQTIQNKVVINFTTSTFHYGIYSLTLEIDKIGYQNQSINLNITLEGRETILEVTLPGKKFEQGDSIEITAILTYVQEVTAGIGAGVLLAPLEAINVSFYVVLRYENETTRKFEFTNQTDDSGGTLYEIDGKYTLGATDFTNITVWSDSSMSGLPASYSMSEEELAEYEIFPLPLNPLEIIISVVIIGVIVLLIVGAVAASGITLNRRRKKRSAAIRARRRKVEQSFEDIKSIRLLIARHESGLQFYSEKTIAELKTDTDALSGMSAALSTFMEEVSDGMRSRTDEEKEKEKIEVMSREGLHMLIWHGTRSSFIIISETRLPDYFKERLASLGREVESKFAHDLQDFYRSDQIPSNQIKKMIRKHIPLHYFSAFILNEGVLTLESIKLSKKEKKMLKLMKEILFQKEGVQFFFSEQIISHLSTHFKRSEAIKFLDRSIEINLLIEASQEDILSLSK